MCHSALCPTPTRCHDDLRASARQAKECKESRESAKEGINFVFHSIYSSLFRSFDYRAAVSSSCSSGSGGSSSAEIGRRVVRLVVRDDYMCRNRARRAHLTRPPCQSVESAVAASWPAAMDHCGTLQQAQLCVGRCCCLAERRTLGVLYIYIYIRTCC